MAETVKTSSPKELTDNDKALCRALDCRFLDFDKNTCRFVQEALGRDREIMSERPDLKIIPPSQRLLEIMKIMVKHLKVPPYFCPKGIDELRPKHRVVIIAHD